MSVFKPYSCKIVAMPVLFDVELSLMNVFRWTCCLSFRTVCCRRCYTCSDALQDAFNNPVSCECHIVVAVEDTKLLFAIAKDAVVPDKGGEISLSGLADQYLAVVAHVPSFEQGNTSYYEMKEIYMEAVFEKIRQRAAMEYPDRKLVLDVKDCGVPANEKLILRVLMNYVKNAFSYSAPDSEVTLRGDRKNNYYRIEVINKGEPIPKEERELIWDAFYKMEKARSRGSGYGVGLSIVREIAMMHHAKYGVHCENGLVTFYFSLPLGK